ncbi:TPA: hypothetical protein JLI63_004060 [Escherichia coli]|nr:hypothetical protein [Escherichia coli]
MMPNATSNQLIEKLDLINFESDKLRLLQYCKPPLKITTYCMLLSVFVMISTVVIYDKISIGLLISLLVSHLFIGFFTTIALLQTSLLWGVIKKISPESDVNLRIKKISKKCIVYSLAVSLIIIAFLIVVELNVVFYSGVVFAIVGFIFSVLFMFRVDACIPKEFICALNMKHLQSMGRLKPEEMKQFSTAKMASQANAVSDDLAVGEREYPFSHGINQATGFPMVNDLFKPTGNLNGSNSLQSNSTPTFSDSHINDISTGFNPASGLPMMNDTFDINGNVFGTTSSFYDEHHSWDSHHSHDNNTWDNYWDSHDRW